MIYREKYLSEIRGFYHSDLIKIITGVRRCGKSFVLEQIMTELSKETDNFVYLDFDDGRKIITSAWQDSNYKGLADVPFNTRVRVTFQYSKKGISYLRSAEVI